MINYINNLYKQEVEDNKQLKEWIDKLAEFILNEHYMMTRVDDEQWSKRKEEIVRKICLGEKK